MEYELAVIGAGNMAEAVMRGMLSGGLITGGQVIAANPSKSRLDLFERELGTAVTTDNRTAAAAARTILLAVKPQKAAAVLAELSGTVAVDRLVVSVMAGISRRTIQSTLGTSRVVRTMPNTPMLVGQGMVAVAGDPSDVSEARQLFESSARIMDVAEEQIDAVVAVSGSGPAYFFLLIEQMARAGAALGLSESQAMTLAKQTALGAATMAVQSGDSPAELRRKVTSPNGTTHAAISTFEAGGFADLVERAMRAAARRSAELGG